MDMEETYANVLVDTVQDYLRSLDDQHLQRFLEYWPSKPFKTRKVFRRLLPVISYLSEIDINEDDNGAAVLKMLKSCAEDLRWGQTYTTKDFSETFLEKYGWAELIGVRGPVASNTIACGFLLLGPNVEYPKHSHEAEEIYVPFNSQAQWIMGKGDWIQRQRGVPIYHSPWIAHGMRTGSTPLLALYIWYGGILDQKPYIE